MIDQEQDAKLGIVVIHNRIRFLADNRQTEEALELHHESEALYARMAGPLVRIKFSWLKGQILQANGDLKAALDVFSSIRQNYLEQDNQYEAALVSLDLASTLDKLGYRKETRRLAAAAFREMTARRVTREALAALILLRNSA
ncbi:MAG TPA: hypothetical protein VFE33_02005 [Thermoanaerobaculia bacterium]|nr:hypothetical protein [Thermoanaerobaculia bacterium]